MCVCVTVLLMAQGLVHLGKGTLTLNPFHSDKALITPVSIAGLMTVMVAMLDSSNSKLYLVSCSPTDSLQPYCPLPTTCSTSSLLPYSLVCW